MEDSAASPIDPLISKVKMATTIVMVMDEEEVVAAEVEEVVGSSNDPKETITAAHCPSRQNYQYHHNNVGSSLDGGALR